MMPITRQITVLSSIRKLRNIYDMHEAARLRHIKTDSPLLLELVYNTDTDPRAPYFSAELTKIGKEWLKNELSKSPEATR